MIRIASGIVSATRQPNCSSIINRSKTTTAGLRSFTSALNPASFGRISCSIISFTPTNLSINSFFSDLEVVVQGLPKATLYPSLAKLRSNCKVRHPAAEDEGSGHTVDNSKMSGRIVQQVACACIMCCLLLPFIWVG